MVVYDPVNCIFLQKWMLYSSIKQNDPFKAMYDIDDCKKPRSCQVWRR
jgi:hypothetical protein